LVIAEEILPKAGLIRKVISSECAYFQVRPKTGWLPDQRGLLVYGYRHPRFGIRARLLDAEYANLTLAPEIVLRDDSGNDDLGYPWATMLSKHSALVAYYFNAGKGTRHIAGTRLAIDLGGLRPQATSRGRASQPGTEW
jgi:hypothetical protein